MLVSLKSLVENHKRKAGLIVIEVYKHLKHPPAPSLHISSRWDKKAVDVCHSENGLGRANLLVFSDGFPR